MTSYRLDQEFTRSGLRIESSRPVEQALSPKAQYDLPPLDAAGAYESAGPADAGLVQDATPTEAGEAPAERPANSADAPQSLSGTAAADVPGSASGTAPVPAPAEAGAQ